MSAATTIELLVETTTSTFDPPHEVTDPDKVDTIAADMAEHGWRGAPIVTEGGSGGMAWTGTHRIAAVRHLRYREGLDVQIEHVDIHDLCAQYDIDLDALRDEHGDYQACVELKYLLPREIVEYLGFDVDGPL